MKKEIWKIINGHENYAISNLGDVKNIKRNVIMNKHTNERGYEFVDLDKKKLKVHRLVAMAFIPNPNNYPQVNHIDCDKKNNCVSNLEWCNNSQNMKHAYENNLRKTNIVLKIDKVSNEIIAKYKGIKEASVDLNGSEKGMKNISAVCLGNRKTYKGYVWKYGGTLW